MINIFIIHGSDDDPKKHWFPWLKKEIEKIGGRVFVPKFPTEDGHVLSRWMKKINEYKKYINEETIFICHSRGCSFLFRFLEENNIKIKAAFLIGGFHKYLWYPKPDNKTDSFFTKPFDWKKIRHNCSYFEIYQSDNDEYVPIIIGEQLMKHLDGKYFLITNAGHFTTRSGYRKFPLLLKKIKNVCNGII